MNKSSTPAIEAFRNADNAARYAEAYEALLGKWPVAYESLRIPTQLGLTHVLVSGPTAAPPLVLLHGMRATALVWQSNVETLSQHFRVHAVDIVGQNGRSVSNRRIRSRQDYALWMCELFDALGIKRASLVGNSYGAFLALNQASMTPDRVDHLILINPAGVFVSVLPVCLRIVWEGLLRALHLRRPGRGTGIASLLGRNVQLHHDDAAWADMVSIISFDRKMRPNLILPRVFTTRELRQIRTPTMLLMGDNDLLYDPKDTLNKAKQRMPSLVTHMLPGAHHIAAMAKPDATNACIIQFCGAENQAVSARSMRNK